MNHGAFDPLHPTLEPVESADQCSRMKLLADFHYSDPCGRLSTTEAGYLTDGASIPRFLWTAVGHPFGIYLRAAIIHDKLCDLADESATRLERQAKREQADLTFYFACLCCGCDYALAQKLLVGVRIGALLLPWQRRDRGAVGRGPASPAALPPTDAELLAIWRQACRQAGLHGAGIDDASAGAAGADPSGTQRGIRPGDRPAIQPLRGAEDLRSLDALILAQARGSAG